MDTNALKKFAQEARKQLLREVNARLQQVLLMDSVERHQKAVIIEDLEKRIKESSQTQLVEEVAYTWFNRLCALRYMDVNGFNRIGVVSPVNGATQPEILQEAKAGYIDDQLPVKRNEVQAYLNNSKPADNPQQEAYRLLLVSVCNRLAEPMPFLFTRIEDYTQLLMPMDILSESSIVNKVRLALSEDACQDVEVIGWLYQFYISEKKDDVMGRKSVVASEDIPAVTQLFTPHWIVQYMVENSLGRLWMLNHPGSHLSEKMSYYIKPEKPETEFLKLNSPEEIRLCDPACGSGHILTYAFDLLYAIYEEMGYDPVQIPALILQHNLYGIEIDQRAGSLAAFALYMKAYERDKSFPKRGVAPKICVMEDIRFSAAELKRYMDKLGSDLFTQDLWEGLKQFEDASTYGSLIRPKVRNPHAVRERMQDKGVFEDLFLFETNRKVEKVLEMIEYLSPRYQVVVANPPYFGGGMDAEYKQFARDHYPKTKSDTFAMFIERNTELALSGGQLGFMTPFVWMFISSYEDLRKFLIEEKTITSLVQLEYSGFEGATVPICTFTLENKLNPDFKGGFIRLSDFRGAENQSPRTQEAIANPDCGWFFRASALDFKKIPGSPIAYWIKGVNNFLLPKIEKIFESGGRNKTHNNEKYVRYIWEVDNRSKKWKFYCNGGEFRKWYGNEYYYVDWSQSAIDFYESNGGLVNPKYWNKEGITWSLITSARSSFRLKNKENMYSSGSPTIFRSDFICDYFILSYLNSPVTYYYLKAINPTLNTTVGNVLDLPLKKIENEERIFSFTKELVQLSKIDWDNFETSWDFCASPFISLEDGESSLQDAYSNVRGKWRQMTEGMKSQEEEINQIFIEAYDLQDELTPEVPLSEITLTCNPYYRYTDTVRKKYTDEEREAMLLEDTMKEFISYAVGCMFGRYSLEKPGLILANQGETVEDYLSKVDAGEPQFMADDDNVIPILEGDWFPDDIANRFKKFLRVTFGEENYEENLAFLEKAIGKDIRSYFVRDFYKDHVQTYKKRPIYWLFSSPKGSFNALIYMHRYQPDTISVLLNKYLREYQKKLQARHQYLESVERNPGASKKDKIDAQKEIRSIEQILHELREYESEVIYPLATKQIKIDLDDGVKVNYEKFGKALKGI
jgi:type II restriction/modification system DNA methylase subunit YeeA